MTELRRREFMQLTAGGVLLFAVPSARCGWADRAAIVSPGCRTSKVKVAKIYIGQENAHWPTPKMDIKAEQQKYESDFARMKDEFSAVEFVVNDLVSTADQIASYKEVIQGADGVLLIHLSMGISEILGAVLALQKPTMLFAAPYSGHEWAGFGGLTEQEGSKFDCILSSDTNQLVEAVKPIRALHHLKHAKILNVTERDLPADFVQSVKEKYGTEVMQIRRDRMMAAYETVPDADAKNEAKRWISNAIRVVEPPEDEIVRSCKLALAFEKLLTEENATCITVDCYGTMYRQLPAFPCIGFTRLNDMGLGGICESDLACAMTHILFQGLAGKPGFISDPTMDMSNQAIILAHCLGTTYMDGPNGPRAPYQLRTIMERQEGAVPQVFMRMNQKVTQAIWINPEELLYFTGTIVDVPDSERGCRTKIAVQVDGDADKVWRKWSHGLHRVTCYEDITCDLKRFSRLSGMKLVCEA